jgi:hypothetical protein
MAHACPNCGAACYCGGDIDDCEFEGTAEQSACEHCSISDEYTDFGDPDLDDLNTVEKPLP